MLLAASITTDARIVFRRWIVALAFALASAAAAGASYGWVTKPYAVELAKLRSQVEFADFMQHRIATMSPAERQQFERLFRLNAAAKR
jgi:hypothetical protein